MAITQLNTADYDYAMMLNVINKSYKGKADITLSAYDTTAASDVKVGSVFEDNGAIFIVDTADITPTGYAGMTNSTTFYLYLDVDPTPTFIYSNTVPVWNDALQGHYNGNDRAFFSMYKDSGGTLYERKCLLLTQNNLQIGGGIQTDNALLKTKVIEIGDWDMSAATGSASKFVAHGFAGTDWKVIRSVNVIIRNDGDTTYSVGQGFLNGLTVLQFGTTNISISRLTGGFFDGVNYNLTSYNRGWVTVIYEA